MPVALGAIAEVIPALMALLLILGAGLLIEFVGRSISASFRIPGLDFIANWVVTAQNKVISGMSGLLSNVVRGVVSFFTAPAHIIAGFLDAVVSFAWAHWTWIHNLIYTDIPKLWNQLGANFTTLVRYISTGIGWLEGYLLGALNSAVGSLTGLAYRLYQQAIEYTSRVEAYIQAWAAGLVAGAEAYALGLYNQAVKFANQLFANAMAYIAAEVKSVEQYAESLANWALQQAIQIASQYAKQYTDWAVGQLESTLSVAAAIALAPAYPRLLDAIDAIAKAIPGTLEGVLEDIRAIPRVVPTSIPGALAALLGIVSVAIEYVARCGVDICRNLHGFGDEVSSLSDAAITAGMIAFVIAATEDPEDTAHATDSYFVEPLATVGRGFASILNIVE